MNEEKIEGRFDYFKIWNNFDKDRSKFEKEINKRKKNAVIISIERIDYEQEIRRLSDIQCGSSKNANGTERFRIRTRESLYPLFPVLCDVWYTRVTVQTVKNQTVYSTNSRIPKRLRKNARSIGSYIKILFLSSFSLLQRKSPIIFTVFFFFFFYLFFFRLRVQSSYPFVSLVYTFLRVLFFFKGRRIQIDFSSLFEGLLKRVRQRVMIGRCIIHVRSNTQMECVNA